MDKVRTIAEDAGETLNRDSETYKSNSDDEDLGWDQYYVKFYKPYINTIIERGGYRVGDGLFAYEQFRTKLMSAVDGFDIRNG